MRTLTYRDGPRAQHLALAAIAAVWLLLCARELSLAIAYPSKLGIAITAACIALPILAMQARRLPIYLLSIYAMLIPFTQLLTVSSGAVGGISSGDTLTKLVGAAAGAAVFVAIVLHRRATTPSQSMLAVAALSVFGGMTVFWAIDPLLALNSYLEYLVYAGLYLVIAAYPASAGEVRLLVLATLAGALASAAYGGYLFQSGTDIFGARLKIGGDTAHYIDPNEYAATFLLPLAIALVGFLGARRIRARIGWGLVSAVLLYGFAISGSRGVFAAFAVMLAFLAMQPKFRVQLLVIAPLVALAAFASPIGQRLGQADLLTADLRTDIWRVGFAALRQYWLAGAGIGNWSQAFQQYYLTVPHAVLTWHRAAHSILLQSAVEYGIGGLALTFWIWWSQFRELRTMPKGESMYDLSLALRAAVLGLFIAGLTLSIMLTKYTWLLFSLVALARSAYLGSGAARNGSERA